jgi:hypothetical protein
MNMQHAIIYNKIVDMLPMGRQSFLGISKDTLLYLLRQTIFIAVTENCRFKGSKSDWVGLPSNKSLFNYPRDTGRPIGNLTSQVFGNVYLNDFDHYVKKKLKIKHCGRYVDDMLFVHEDKQYLESVMPQLREQVFLAGLRLHPNKIFLKPITEGIPFLGHIIKPHRNYIGNRAKNNFYQAIHKINKVMAVVPQFSWRQFCEIRAKVNSYLGIVQHAHSYNLRKAMLAKFIRRFSTSISLVKISTK